MFLNSNLGRCSVVRTPLEKCVGVCTRGLTSEDSPKIQKVDPSCHGQAMTCCGLVGNKGVHFWGIQYIGLYRDYVGIILPYPFLATGARSGSESGSRCF